jgi:hypothetical protein
VEDECKKDETGTQTDRTRGEEDREDADCLVTYEKIKVRGWTGLPWRHADTKMEVVEEGSIAG